MTGKDAIRGITILQQYAPSGDVFLEADHDVIWATGAPREVSAEHAEQLRVAGWHWGEFDCWTHGC